MSLTYAEKLDGFNQILALDNLTAEERFWVEKFKEFLTQGHFHDTWSRLRDQAPHVEALIFSAVTKVRQHAQVVH